jgi:hypothetical protein
MESLKKYGGYIVAALAAIAGLFFIKGRKPSGIDVEKERKDAAFEEMTSKLLEKHKDLFNDLAKAEADERAAIDRAKGASTGEAESFWNNRKKNF